MDDISIRLTNGQVLFFSPVAEIARWVSPGSKDGSVLAEIESVTIGSSSSERVSQLLDDFVLRNSENPDEIIVVELKSRRPEVVPQLSDSLLQRRMPEIFRTAKLAKKQLWEVNLRLRNIGVFSIDSNGHVAKKGTRYKIRSLIEPIGDLQTPSQGGAEVTAGSIQARVDDWVQRIETLYEHIAAWLTRTPFSVIRGNGVTIYEELMQQFGVPEARLPTLRVLKGDTDIIELRPYGLWTIGGNGRIDIVGRHQSAILVDAEKFPLPPKWRLYSTKTKSGAVPFDKSALLTLLES
jgi:hypothetical protein